MGETFAKLHEDVLEFGRGGFEGLFAFFDAGGDGFHEIGVLADDGFVEFFLDGGHAEGDDDFAHRW